MAETLLDAARAGDTRSIARIVTAVEDRTDDGRSLAAELFSGGGSAHLTGVTGAPGSGKSTLVSELIPYLATGGRIAVVAIDPSSPFTGGAILGDRVRMGSHTSDQRVFIRSLANRGSLGGISESTPAVVAAFDGLGFDEVLIETVGVGQSEVEIASTANTTVVVVSPGWGDSVQASKAGLLEVADVLVVNKADRDGADSAIDDLTGMLAMGPVRSWTPPVIRACALDGTGIVDLASAIQSHRDHLASSGELELRIRRRAAAHLSAALHERALTTSGTLTDDGLIDRIARREVDPWSAAASVLAGP